MTKEQPFPAQITTMPVARPVVGAIELRCPPSADHQQVETVDDLATVVAKLMLGLNGNPGEDVQESKQRLPGRLAASICQCERLPQHTNSASTLPHRAPDAVDRRLTAVKGTVDDDDQIDEAQVLRKLDDRPLGGSNRKSVANLPMLGRQVAATDVDTATIEMRCFAVRASDDWEGLDARKPPSSQERAAQVGENGIVAKYKGNGRTHCVELVRVAVVQRRPVRGVSQLRTPEGSSRVATFERRAMKNRFHPRTLG